MSRIFLTMVLALLVAGCAHVKPAEFAQLADTVETKLSTVDGSIRDLQREWSLRWEARQQKDQLQEEARILTDRRISQETDFLQRQVDYALERMESTQEQLDRLRTHFGPNVVPSDVRVWVNINAGRVVDHGLWAPSAYGGSFYQDGMVQIDGETLVKIRNSNCRTTWLLPVPERSGRYIISAYQVAGQG